MQAPTTVSRLDGGVDLLGRQQRVVALDDDDLAGVDDVVDPAVDDEEGEVGAHGLGVHEQRGVHAHLVGQLDRGALRDLGVRHRQGEGDLHHAVAGGVAVGHHHARGGPLGLVGRVGHHTPSFASRISVAGL
jgi:hypothetical protein